MRHILSLAVGMLLMSVANASETSKSKGGIFELRLRGATPYDISVDKILDESSEAYRHLRRGVHKRNNRKYLAGAGSHETRSPESLQEAAQLRAKIEAAKKIQEKLERVSLAELSPHVAARFSVEKPRLLAAIKMAEHS